MNKKEFVCDCNIVHKEIVDNILNNMENTLFYKNLSKFFKILGDETRIKIIWVLNKNELCVCDLCNILNMTKSAVSHQLAYLRKERVVKFKKIGKSVYYSLDDEHIKNIFEISVNHLKEEK